MRLIVNADDFGLAPSVNQAIIDCFLRGNVTSATMMANMPAAEAAAALARAHPALKVGLHLNLTEGRPLSACPSLTGAEGRFLGRAALLFRSALGLVAAADVARESLAQLARLRAFGVAVSHIDSHQHVHMGGALFSTVSGFANEHDLPLRLVRPPPGGLRAALSPVKALKQAALRIGSRGYAGRLRRRTNDCLVAIHDLPDPARVGAADYGRLLAGAGAAEIVELMVHPYIVGPDVSSLYGGDLPAHAPFLEKCVREYELLSGPSLFSGIPGISLTTYEDL